MLPVGELLGRLSRDYAHEALHDPLTGLPNRSLFQRRLAQELRARRGVGRARALLFIDVDRFKAVNDSMGHDAGDLLLVELARRLTDVVRPGDLIARHAGDEFAVLLADDGTRHAQDVPATVAERLVNLVRVPIGIKRRDVIVGASIGIVDLETADSEDPVELMRFADLAMYRAKSAGGGTHATYSAAMSVAVADQLDMESGLARAAAAGELVLRFQPKVLVDRGDVVEVEALLRWQRPGIGTLAPDTFIPVAERTGLIVPIGRWVLQEACRQAAQWHSEHPEDAWRPGGHRRLRDRLLLVGPPQEPAGR